jgi:hypothetical protein
VGDRKRKAQRRLSLEVLEDRTVPTAVAVPANVVSWWTANSTPNDVYGLNNGANTGTTYVTGEVNKAFSFDGTDDRVQLTDAPSLQFTTSFSIEGWIQVNGFPTGTNGDDHGEILFRGDDRGGLDPYSLSVEPDGMLHFQVTSTNASAGLSAPIVTGQFIHVAATLDDATGTMSLYENGVIGAQEVTTTRPFQNLDPTQNPSIAIGNHGGYPASPHNFPFNGLVDELAVYNRALTQGEVLGIYKAGSSGKVISPIAVSNPSVVDGSGGATSPVTFTITRTGSLSGSYTVNWTTSDDTAIAGTNYTAASGTITFADGQATQNVTVTTLDDGNPNPNLEFKLIATPSGGTSVMGVATIINDDASISAGNGSAIEGSNVPKLLDRFVTNGSGGLARPRGSIFGPDANGDGKPDLYVTSADTNAVLRYDSVTGSYIDTFVTPGSGGLSSPVGLAYGSDNNLYVTSYGSNQLLRYNGTTGAFIDVVSSNLSSPEGITLGPDGKLYIATFGTNEVLQYDGSSLNSFVTAASGGLSKPRYALFGPDANGDGKQDLYVTSEGNNTILCYDGVSGAFIKTFATIPTGQRGPFWLAFGTDGLLYSTDWTQTTGTSLSIVRYTATTGTLYDTTTVGNEGWAFTLGAGNIIYDSGTGAGPFVDRIGPSSIVAIPVSLASACAGTTTVSYATADGSALAGTHYNTTSGTLTFAPGETVRSFLVSTLDDGTADPTRSFTITLSNPTGGVITNSQGTGTILDDAKFYVVDDGTTDRTYQYATAGSVLGNTTVTSADTAPRGVATTAAGTTEWVVDANKNVYVYSTGGTLLGSWSASGLSSSAKLTGIATNGTDIWLVDSYTAKVYDFAGAASRLSGSQSAASFSLSSSKKSNNTNPQDIVTDGTSFWVVDGTALKVFKYSLSGTLLGSWAIDTANKNPTGITINPNNVSDIWIVDNGTNKVYQYTAAASRTTGSQSAAASFALAANNTNPQGIADPPTAGDLLPSAPTPSVVVLPALPPATLVPAATIRDAFFALLGNAPSTGPVNQITQRPAERNVPANLPPSPEAAPIMATRSDAVFAGSQEAADDVLTDMPFFTDEDVSVAVE